MRNVDSSSFWWETPVYKGLEVPVGLGGLGAVGTVVVGVVPRGMDIAAQPLRGVLSALPSQPHS